MSESDDSDYVVEQYIRPKTCSVPLVNDESADLLGNFDDSKRKSIENDIDNNMEDNSLSGYEESENKGEGLQSGDASDDENSLKLDHILGSNVKEVKKKKSSKVYDGKISQEQIASLLRGSTKSNRFVLYVTNLNFGTSKERLTEYFSTSGNVKSVRIPKKRKGGFAFVEMVDIDGFKNAFSLHNTMLDDRPIKIQLSEAGKKKICQQKEYFETEESQISRNAK